jgi:hypothetical protein
MKGITWNKVPPNKIAQTVWAKTSDFEVSLDTKHMEELFGAAVVEKKHAEEDDQKKKRKDPVSLIDGKRAQNLNILLGSKLSKLSFDDIKKAVLALDDSVLLPEVTKALLGFVPTEEEVCSFLSRSMAMCESNWGLPLDHANHRVPKGARGEA